jgi:hypothetical protein
MKYFYVPEAVSLIAEQGLDLRREQDGCICKTGGTQIAWSRARVYSFVTGGKTRSTADKDLWEKYKAKKKD